MLAVLGAGAVGGLLAALVHRAGGDVVLVGRPAMVAEIAARGIRVTSPTLGQWTALVPASTQLPAGADVVLTVKAHALPAVLPALSAASPAHAMSVLNGVGHADLLRTTLPTSAVAGASITVEVTRRRPAEVEHRSRFIRLAVPATAADWTTVEDLRAAAPPGPTQ
ncbi:ketopantoate reductase family protein [Micromonospora sp. H33]|uniref:ketopantoate reductase family protein n=1 Tax=Micromonospora sp. H33 TaxID=3452215 RepID=UPI003F8AD773